MMLQSLKLRFFMFFNVICDPVEEVEVVLVVLVVLVVVVVVAVLVVDPPGCKLARGLNATEML